MEPGLALTLGRRFVLYNPVAFRFHFAGIYIWLMRWMELVIVGDSWSCSSKRLVDLGRRAGRRGWSASLKDHPTESGLPKAICFPQIVDPSRHQNQFSAKPYVNRT